MVWAEPKFTKFHKPFLVKSALLSVWEILSFANSLVGFCHLALLCRSSSAMKISNSQCICCKFHHHQAVTHKLHHSCNQAKYQQNAPQQKLSILLHKPRRSTICCHISSFSKISIKSSKNNDLLAILVKFNQASDPHLPRQRKFVKNERSICTA